MASRRRAQRHPYWNSWLYEYITRFLGRCEFLLYAALCAVLHRLLFQELLPGRMARIFLVVVLVMGIPSDQPWGKVATLIRGLLELLARELPGASPGSGS